MFACVSFRRHGFRPFRRLRLRRKRAQCMRRRLRLRAVVQAYEHWGLIGSYPSTGFSYDIQISDPNVSVRRRAV
jgi:hypothetical protein